MEVWGFWITGEPLIKPIGNILKFLVPLSELTIALMLLKKRYRMISLYLIIASQILFIVWIMSVYLFTHNLFWPFHAIWGNSTWIQRMMYALFSSWLAFTAILLTKKSISRKKPL
jgi:hypothetical protein